MLKRVCRVSRLLSFTNVVSSKSFSSKQRPPDSPGSEECCGTGCSDCCYLKYAEGLVDFYRDGGEKALEEVDKITDPSVRMFVRTEIKFYLKLDEESRRRMRAEHEAKLD